MRKVQPGEQHYHGFQLHSVKTVSLCSDLHSLLALPVVLLVYTCYLTKGNAMEGHSHDLSQGHRQCYQVSTQFHWADVACSSEFNLIRFNPDCANMAILLVHLLCSGVKLQEPKKQCSGIWTCIPFDLCWKAPCNFILGLMETRRLQMFCLLMIQAAFDPTGLEIKPGKIRSLLINVALTAP